MSVLYLCVIGFGCAWLSASVGAGGGPLLMPLLYGVVPVSAINPVQGLVQLIGSVHRMILRRRELQWRIVAEFAVPCVVCSICSACVPLALSERALLLILGWGVLGNLVLGEILKGRKTASVTPEDVDGAPRNSERAPWFQSLAMAGVVQGLVASTIGGVGGVTSVALMGYNLTHPQRATHIAATGFVMNSCRVVMFLWWGFAYINFFSVIAILTLASIAGTLVGIRCGEWMSEDVGRRLLQVVALFAGLKMIAAGSGLL